MPSLTRFLFLLLPALAHALLVAPNSPCAPQCGNVLTTTSGAEISCNDGDYASSTYGPAFESCLNCELASTYVDPQSNMTDLQAALFNLRFAVSWCLWGYDNNTNVANTQCLTTLSCGPLNATFEYGLNSSNAAAYDYGYCDIFDQHANQISEPKCSPCIAETGHNWYLSNFITIVYGACVQTPNPGTILSYQGNIFSTTQVNLTTPAPTSLPYDNGYSDGLSLGAKVGISVGAILVTLFIAGFCIVCIGRRRRKRFLREKARQSGYEWDVARHGHVAMADSSAGERTPGGFFDSPQSQKPFANAWGYPQDVKSAHSLQDSPVTPIVRQSRMPDWPRDRKSPLDDTRGERIEMMGVGGGGISHPQPMLQPSSMR